MYKELKVIREYLQIDVKALSHCTPVHLETNTKSHVVVKQPKDLFFQRHTQLVSSLEQSQRDQLDLVKDLKQRIRINQNIRRMNLEYLVKRNSGVSKITRPRRISVVTSLDSGVREQHERHRWVTTSEYGTLSTATSTTHHLDEQFHLENNDNSHSGDYNYYRLSERDSHRSECML